MIAIMSIKEFLEDASRSLMSVLQYGHSDRPVHYAPKTPNVVSQNASSSSSSISIRNFPTWASNATGLPVYALTLVTLVRIVST